MIVNRHQKGVKMTPHLKNHFYLSTKNQGKICSTLLFSSLFLFQVSSKWTNFKNYKVLMTKFYGI